VYVGYDGKLPELNADCATERAAFPATFLFFLLVFIIPLLIVRCYTFRHTFGLTSRKTSGCSLLGLIPTTSLNFIARANRLPPLPLSSLRPFSASLPGLQEPAVLPKCLQNNRFQVTSLLPVGV